MNLYNVVKKVISTEKASSASSSGVFTIYVDMKSDKKTVKRVFEELYGVTVVAVNVLRTHGKTKRFRNSKGGLRDLKKAFVRVGNGKQVDFTKIS